MAVIRTRAGYIGTTRLVLSTIVSVVFETSRRSANVFGIGTAYQRDLAIIQLCQGNIVDELHSETR